MRDGELPPNYAIQLSVSASRRLLNGGKRRATQPATDRGRSADRDTA